jgi:hypothetical protein
VLERGNAPQPSDAILDRIDPTIAPAPGDRLHSFFF